MACPVIDSSTSALSSPVWRHCEANRLRERAATIRVSSSEKGITTSDTQASSGEMVSIMITTPTMVSTAVSMLLSVCWRLWAMLSMSLVTRLSRSPRAWLST